MSAFYHDSACAIAVDGRVVAAAQEERFSRVRYDAGAPLHAFRYCLTEAGVSPGDVDLVAYYEDPREKLGRQLWMEFSRPPEPGPAPWLDATMPERILRARLGFEAPFETVGHHESHAASAFFWSGFEDAALFTADAVGEWDTTSYGKGGAGGIELFHSVRFPHSLGLFYSTITGYLGFSVNSDEYKVMGLASYGRPRLVDRLRETVAGGTGGDFRLDPRFFRFRPGAPMFTEALGDLVGFGPRAPGGPLGEREQDLARSAQVLLEELLLTELNFLAERSASENLCYSGGVALNCVANRRLRLESPFRHWFVPPAPGDAGGAVGAALLAAQRHGIDPRGPRVSDARLGPQPGGEALRATLERADVAYEDFAGRTPDLLQSVAAHLGQRRVVGWCRGRMEFGPRALGARSILADPREESMRTRVNRLVKKREEFRPFAPVVVAEHADDFFAPSELSPFMLETVPVRRPGAPLGAVTHVDGSARVQTVDAEVMPDLHALLLAFEAHSGVPILLNTSFNLRGEPIVCDDLDALLCFVRAEIDVLVVGDLVVEQRAVPSWWREKALTAADVYGWAPEQVFAAYSFFS